MPLKDQTKTNVRDVWQEELVNSIRTIDDLDRALVTNGGGKLSDKKRAELSEVLGKMRMSITPHTAKLIDWSNKNDPLYLMAVPTKEELLVRDEEMVDPIGDTIFEHVPFLTHRYKNRVLVYPIFSCSHYCRFCFRRYRTGHATIPPSPKDMEKIREYLVEHPEVDEVILSGGDPLLLTDDHLERWMKLLRGVGSVVRIRLHTRVPVNLPSRISSNLVDLLCRYQDATHPVVIVTHFNHPRELTNENILALARIADAGIVLRNQSVLLKGVNDNSDTLAELCNKLVNVRVHPYYLHQLDLAKGTSHFRVPIEKGLEIMDELHVKLSGIARPQYMLDVPGGKGKVCITKESVRSDNNGNYKIKMSSGELVDYTVPM